MSEPATKKAKTEANADFGVFGMGTMGQNLALNIAERGYRLAAYNRPDEFQARIWGALERAKKEGEAAGKTILIDAHTELPDFVAALKTPRRILLSIPSGKPVDMTLEALTPLLSAGSDLLYLIFNYRMVHCQTNLRLDQTPRPPWISKPFFLRTNCSVPITIIPDYICVLKILL